MKDVENSVQDAFDEGFWSQCVVSLLSNFRPSRDASMYEVAMAAAEAADVALSARTQRFRPDSLKPPAEVLDAIGKKIRGEKKP